MQNSKNTLHKFQTKLPKRLIPRWTNAPRTWPFTNAKANHTNSLSCIRGVKNGGGGRRW